MSNLNQGRLPVAFVSHGAPVSLEDTPWMEDLDRWGKSFGAVREILVLSAHWVTRRLLAAPAKKFPLLFDFFGFPDRFYKLDYPCPASSILLGRLPALTGLDSMQVDPERGLDHGMWVPLRGLFPNAEIPVLGLSLPGLAPMDLFRLGERLSPLRDEGVLILCSGGMTHNLGYLRGEMAAPPEEWAIRFDGWVTERILAGDNDSILDFEHQAPFAHRAHPSTEHFAPLFVALGASGAAGGPVSFPVTGFRWGTLSMRSVQFGLA